MCQAHNYVLTFIELVHLDCNFDSYDSSPLNSVTLFGNLFFGFICSKRELPAGPGIEEHSIAPPTFHAIFEKTFSSCTFIMQNDGFAALDDGKAAPKILLPCLTFRIGVANLDINDGSRDPFSAYNPEPPPAPKLTSQGVIAIDITEQFIHAAQRPFASPGASKVFHDHVLTDCRARAWATDQGPLFHVVRGCGRVRGAFQCRR